MFWAGGGVACEAERLAEEICGCGKVAGIWYTEGMYATLDIPDSLYGELEALSAKEGKTLSAFAVSLLRDWMTGNAKGFASCPASATPGWAGLCETDVTRNADGPHDMESIRRSIAEARAEWRP